MISAARASFLPTLQTQRLTQLPKTPWRSRPPGPWRPCPSTTCLLSPSMCDGQSGDCFLTAMSNEALPDKYVQTLKIATKHLASAAVC